MADYHYVAVNGQGKRLKGQASAESPQELLDLLAKQGLHCLSYEGASGERKPTTTYRMKTREIVIFCRQLETMLGAGVTISRGFDVLRDKAVKPKMKQLYQNIFEGLQMGLPLSEAMRGQGRSFPPMLIHMVASGEASGTLDSVARRMSVHFTNEMKLANKIRAAMIYPVILLAVSVAVVLLLFTMVLPRLFGMFGDTELPAVTRLLMSLSQFLVEDWYWLLGGVVVLVVLLIAVYRTEKGRLFFDTLRLKLPKIGKLLRTVQTAQFASSMATLYASGIPVIRSLEISCEILDNAYFTKQFNAVIEKVGSGQPLAASVEGTEIFDSMFVSLLFVGEESGDLDRVLAEASDYYDVEAQAALERMVSMLEPVMIVILAVIIGFIITAVIVPIYSMYGQIA